MSKPEFVYVTMIAATPEEVWRGLTTPEFTQQYWHSTRIRSDFKPGSSIEFLNPDGSVGVCGKILRADHPDTLAYTWQFARDPNLKDDAPSRVTFTLQRFDVGTRLTVVHDQLEEGSETLAAVSFGWPHVICGLKTLLETETAIDFSTAEPGCPGQGSATASA